jgi:uncharacterized protein (DUF1330 family)
MMNTTSIDLEFSDPQTLASYCEELSERIQKTIELYQVNFFQEQDAPLTIRVVIKHQADVNPTDFEGLFFIKSYEPIRKSVLKSWRTFVPSNFVACAYVIASIDVHDAPNYGDYGKLVPQTLQDYGGHALVRSAELHWFEGGPHSRAIVIRFANRNRALDWYHSPGYTAARALRQKMAQSQICLAPSA